MPFVEVTSSTGKTKFKYTICTPSSEEAKEIDAGLPTILFLHPVSLAEYLFTGQFSDQQLRRCNLVSFDLRGHGNTFGDSAPCDYGQVEAAEDTIQLMALLQNSLNLPPCHLVGVSSGTIIALQLAVTQPQRILSMFLISQSCTEMPAEVAGGHHEILDLWTCAFPDKTTTLPELISDAEFGQRQYLFTEPKLSPLVDAILSLTSKVAKKRWCYPFLDQYQILNHDFNVNRSSTSQMALAQITSPVILAYGSGDVAYPQIYTEQFLHELLEAGVDASLLVIKNAPHCMIPDYSKK
ncbi:Alpha/Beta hydrolase protein [Lentinula edodes]|uniref:Alpha/Beta hydrolase protein n=1 Tax=Lentinula edodes TaxID=5353 RepID=UPI001E8D6E71|nr:Alpha/Beta hydrolase protein [Lentinula edodes]KAH7878293.1 Alpha/Beta hydrolase protein [Lentinula edodes]KAJ3911941.1 Alpha/Beta hydrolase protein [Lentinula edodes]